MITNLLMLCCLSIMEAKLEENFTLILNFSLEKNDTNSNPLAKVESKIVEGLHKDTRKVV